MKQTILALLAAVTVQQAKEQKYHPEHYTND